MNILPLITLAAYIGACFIVVAIFSLLWFFWQNMGEK